MPRERIHPPKPATLTMLVDTREQTPLPFNPPVVAVRATLKTGDYTAVGIEDSWIAERKSVDDAVGTVIHQRERFEAELARMSPFRWRTIYIVGASSAMSCYRQIEEHCYRSMAEPKAVLASLYALRVRYGVQLAFCDTPSLAAAQMAYEAYYALREANAIRWEQGGRRACTPIFPAAGEPPQHNSNQPIA